MGLILGNKIGIGKVHIGSNSAPAPIIPDGVFVDPETEAYFIDPETGDYIGDPEV